MAAAVPLLALAGCGGNERTFTAAEFVDRINEQGVEMTLGQRLSSEGSVKELFGVTIAPLPGEPPPAPDDENGAGITGSLYVYEDTGGADDQMRACADSGGLLCYQASNVVVVLEEGGLGAARLAAAIRKLAD